VASQEGSVFIPSAGVYVMSDVAMLHLDLRIMLLELCNLFPHWFTLGQETEQLHHSSHQLLIMEMEVKVKMSLCSTN
jgi:hypothetical protein